MVLNESVCVLGKDVPGHGIAGIVWSVGEKVTEVRVGDRVVVFPWVGCGECEKCHQGRDNLCEGECTQCFADD